MELSDVVRRSSFASAMSDVTEVMHVVDSHCVSERLSSAPNRNGSGGLMNNGQYAWFADGPNMIVYSKYHGCVLSNRSFAVNQKDKSLKVSSNFRIPLSVLIVGVRIRGCSVPRHIKSTVNSLKVPRKFPTIN